MFLPLSNTITDSAIAGVHLHDARTQPVVPVGTESKMLGQVANLACAETILEVIHLKDVLLLAIPPREPRLAETDVATNAEQRRTTTTVVIAQAATLGLGRPNYLNLRPNQIGIQGEPSSLHHIQNGVKLV
jgi:hypothetical protein